MNNKQKSELQDEIIENLSSPAHGLLKLAPRAGKTRIAINILKKEKPKSILWVTSKTDLRDTAIPLEFKQWKALTLFKKTKIICYGSLSSTSGHFDKIVLDEYQDITPANVVPMFTGDITYNSIIGLSGTHPKHEQKLDIYDKLGLGTLADMSIDEGVEKGLLADYAITVVEVDIDNTEKVVKAGTKLKPFMTTEKKQYDYLDNAARQALFQHRPDAKWKILARMRTIYNSLSKERAAQFLINTLPGRKLVFCGGIDQAERLSPHSYHSKKSNDDNLKAFMVEEIDLLTLVNAGGIGSTYRNVDHFIIIQADSDKKGGTTQKLARSLLEQGDDYKANIWFLSLLDTQDPKWVEKALENFDIKKVKYERIINIKNQAIDIL